jgi:hypothetical protein
MVATSEIFSDMLVDEMFSFTLRDLVLKEMRQMLTAVHGVIDAAARADQNAMEAAARVSGTAMAADVNPMLMAKLPLEFKRLGMTVYANFDHLAAVAAGAEPMTALRDLSSITARYIACHSVYRMFCRNYVCART